jgi:AraC-type transcriptional regulator N-terminus
MPLVRELLSREEIQAPEAPSNSPAMATGETTAELLDACCRLVALLDTPQHIPFLSGLIQREIIYRILQGRRGRVFGRLQRWEIKATEQQRRLRGSGRTTRSRYEWKTSQKSQAWASPHCTTISGR